MVDFNLKIDEEVEKIELEKDIVKEEDKKIKEKKVIADHEKEVGLDETYELTFKNFEDKMDDDKIEDDGKELEKIDEIDETEELKILSKDINFYSDKHPLNSIYNRVLRNLY